MGMAEAGSAVGTNRQRPLAPATPRNAHSLSETMVPSETTFQSLGEINSSHDELAVSDQNNGHIASPPSQHWSHQKMKPRVNVSDKGTAHAANDTSPTFLETQASNYPPVGSPQPHLNGTGSPYFTSGIGPAIFRKDENSIPGYYDIVYENQPAISSRRTRQYSVEKDVPYRSIEHEIPDGRLRLKKEDFSDDEYDASHNESDSEQDLRSMRDVAQQPRKPGKAGARGRGLARGRGGRGGRRGGRAAPIPTLGPVRVREPSVLSGIIHGRAPSESPFRPYAGRGSTRATRARGWARGKKRGPQMVDPGVEFKEAQNKAYNAFIAGDLDEALASAKEAVRLNPEIFQAHALLSEIYLAKSMPEESVGVLWCGAHTRRDAGTWWEVAKRTAELGGKDVEATVNQLFSCYDQILKLDPKSFAARKAILSVYLDYNIDFRPRTARLCANALEQKPHDLDVLRVYAEVSIQFGDASEALNAYAKAVKLFQENDNKIEEFEFTFSDLNFYLELFEHLSQWKEGIETLKRISRWLCGRQDERVWQQWLLDDREWDMEHSPRRDELPIFKAGIYPISSYGEALPPEMRAKLATFRIRKGLDDSIEARKHLRHFDITGKTGFTASEYPDLFRDIAGALHSASYHSEAVRFYEEAENVDDAVDAELHAKIAQSYAILEKIGDSIRHWEKAIMARPSRKFWRVQLSELYRRVGQVELAEAQLTAIGGDPRLEVRPKANEPVMWIRRPLPRIEPKYPYPPEELQRRFATGSLILPVHESLSGEKTPTATTPGESTPISTTAADSSSTEASTANNTPRKRRNQDTTESGNTPKRQKRLIAAPKSSSVQLNSILLCSSIVLAFHKIDRLRAPMRNGSEGAILDWVNAAREFCSGFDKVKFLFKSNRASTRAQREYTVQQASSVILQEFRHDDKSVFSEATTTFQTLSLSVLLEILCKYSFLCAKQNDSEAVNNALELAEHAEIFAGDEDCEFHVQACSVACGLILDDDERLGKVSRWYMAKYPYATDTFRLHTAIARFHEDGSHWFASPIHQKLIHRMIRGMDCALLSPSQRDQSNFTRREITANNKATTTSPHATPGNPHGLRHHDVVLLSLYGHMLHEQPALQYHLRAYAVDKTNAMTALNLAVSYLDLAVKRTTGNERHQLSMLAMAFMNEYKRLRLPGENLPSGVLRPEGEIEPDATPTLTARDTAARLIEVHFNEGRMWHVLGQAHLAAQAYQRCLEVDTSSLWPSAQDNESGSLPSAPGSSVSAPEPITDYRPEAAYALQQLLAFSGDLHGARSIAEKWLVF